MAVSSRWVRRRAVDGTEEPVVDHVAASTRGQRWGEPGWCPTCGTRGYLDRIDLLARDLYQHCPSCDFHWITGEADLEQRVPHERG